MPIIAGCSTTEDKRRWSGSSAWRRRFAETIPVLEPLVQRQPGDLQYRVWLMNAYSSTGKAEQFAKLLKETHDYFHQENRWDENAMAMLGRSCLENECYRPAADYLGEAIALRQRTAANRGIGDGTLSGYYGDQARAFAGLKKTPEAVDAAAAAVVAWGSNIEYRNSALSSLRAVLRAAPDLDAYVVRVDKQAAETRQENPVLRKAIGQVYRDEGQVGKAIQQLLIAAEVQPNDAETYQALVACYDRRSDQQGAVEQIFAWRESAPRDIKLYEDLGKRLEKLGPAAEVERAYTSIVEALPAESESHQLLAEIRQRQDRWAEAVEQWRQVARLRAMEPTGLLGLCEALVHERRFAEAGEVLAQAQAEELAGPFRQPSGESRPEDRQPGARTAAGPEEPEVRRRFPCRADFSPPYKLFLTMFLRSSPAWRRSGSVAGGRRRTSRG